jgi:hypothetical protein
VLKSICSVWLLFWVVASAFAQTADSSANRHKGFFKNWRLAGVELSMGRAANKNNAKSYGLFNSAFPNSAGADKLKYDLAATKGFDHHTIAYRGDGFASINLNAVFKPRIITPKSLLSYTEIVAGLYNSEHYFDLDMGGDSFFNVDNYNHFYTGYSASINSVGFNFGGLLQTPSPNNALALYTGCVLFGAYNYVSEVRLSESRFQETTSAHVWDNDYKVLFERQINNSFAKFGFGFNIPVGLKLNLSQRSNIFVEYNARCTNYKSNAGIYTTWHKGMSLGYRFKFITKAQREERKKALQNQPNNPENITEVQD